MTTTAFTGGLVWTAGYRAPRPLDVLVEDGVVTDVRARGDLPRGSTRVHDISGRLLVPGFQDAHLHLGGGGADLLTCDLAGLRTAEEVFAAVEAYARAHPDLPWVVGGGWDRSVFPYPEGPTRQQLDRLVGDRPALLSPFDRHGAWVSSAALRAAGIDDATPDPPGGFLRHDDQGSLTGMLEEEAVALVRRVMPVLTVADHRAAVLRAQEHLLPMGITSVQDALVGTGLGMPDTHAALCELLAAGDLRLRLTTALWWDAARGVEQIPELLERRRLLEEAAGPERVVADTAKLMVDGAGLVFLEEARVREATVALDAAGFSVHYHSYGDLSTRWILDGVQDAVEANGPRERRHQIAHLFVVDPADFARFARLGVTANVQGFWAGSPVPHDHLGHSSAVADPQTLEYPFGRLQAAGARFAAGSDWPVTTPDPLVCAQTATGRYVDEDQRRPLTDVDRVDLSTMLEAYTVGSAYVNGRAHSTGRIAPGFLADLVLLDGDVFAADRAVDTAVVASWIDGEPAFVGDGAR